MEMSFSYLCFRFRKPLAVITWIHIGAAAACRLSLERAVNKKRQPCHQDVMPNVMPLWISGSKCLLLLCFLKASLRLVSLLIVSLRLTWITCSMALGCFVPDFYSLKPFVWSMYFEIQQTYGAKFSPASVAMFTLQSVWMNIQISELRFFLVFALWIEIEFFFATKLRFQGCFGYCWRSWWLGWAQFLQSSSSSKTLHYLSPCTSKRCPIILSCGLLLWTNLSSLSFSFFFSFFFSRKFMWNLFDVGSLLL